MTAPKRLLIVAHAPSPNTEQMRDAVAEGAASVAGLDIVVRSPLQAGSEDVLAAQALILGTPENLGYMSGALKDFFDRVYYPCLDVKQGLPYALYIRAGQSAGDGSRRSVESIVGGLKWKAVQAPLVCCGPFREDFIQSCRDLGEAMGTGLEMGIF